MMLFFLVFLIGLLKVAARAFQQRNVVFDKWMSIIPTTYIMASMEILLTGFTALEFVENGFSSALFLILSYGTGGWLGCWFAMWFHKKVHK